MPRKPSTRTRRDRWADWAVIAVLGLALALGWAVMTYAEDRHQTYTDAASGLTLDYPYGWLLTGGEGIVFRAMDPAAAEFKTTYEVRSWAIDSTAPLTPSLASILNDASLARAQQGTAFRLLEIGPGKAVSDKPTMEATYVYVLEPSDLFEDRLPVIVQGLDVAVPYGDQAWVFTLLASKERYERSLPGFLRFVESAELK